jgi:DNA-binding CsgD family transcriptional regulator
MTMPVGGFPVWYHILLWGSLLSVALGLASVFLILLAGRFSGTKDKLLPAFHILSLLVLLYLTFLVYYTLNVEGSPSALFRAAPLTGLIGALLVALRTGCLLLMTLSSVKKSPPWILKVAAIAVPVAVFLFELPFHFGLLVLFPEALLEKLWFVHQMAESAGILSMGLVLPGFVASRKNSNHPDVAGYRMVLLFHIVFSPGYLLAWLDYLLTRGMVFGNIVLVYSLMTAALFVTTLLRTLKTLKTGIPESNPVLVQGEKGESDLPLLSLLSLREREVLGLMLKNMKPEAIADTLFISLRTVNTHIGSIYRKYGVSGRIELQSLLDSKMLSH